MKQGNAALTHLHMQSRKARRPAGRVAAMAFIVCALLLSTFQNPLRAEELFFTYIGPAFSTGMHSLHYSEWATSHRETKSDSGNYFGGGLMLNIVANNLICSFTMQYVANTAGNSAMAVQHMQYTATGKYMYAPWETVFFAGGLGLYFDTPPATKSYDGGGGINATIGAGFNMMRDWRVIVDLTGKYGFYGRGEDATRIAYGLTIAAIMKIGRL